MTEQKIIESKGRINPGKPGKPKYRVVMRDGRRVQLRIVDADSPSFTADLISSFAANVRRARTENQALKVVDPEG